MADYQEFTIPALAALYPLLEQGPSNNERQAAARAVLRYNAHVDGAHYYTRRIAGLHLSYIAFNPDAAHKESSLQKEELAGTTLQDVFDAITAQDRLDGGISFLVRCPGFNTSSGPLPEHIPIDLYITPCELAEIPEQTGRDTAQLLIGAAQNHQQQISQVWAQIHKLINDKLKDITDDPNAKMQWVLYWQNIVQRYQVIIEGWPSDIPFENLSKACSSLLELDKGQKRTTGKNATSGTTPPGSNKQSTYKSTEFINDSKSEDNSPNSTCPESSIRLPTPIMTNTQCSTEASAMGVATQHGTPSVNQMVRSATINTVNDVNGEISHRDKDMDVSDSDFLNWLSSTDSARM
ncbi:hypothetical protein SERLADRAFT_433994 [Serpula lacrymans var. lacrymans S7.9]|uniref:Uncharacterized protein n=1 Tax=Serpula lacrymans var. lacrymans (strain S7.9) TaxID=578457 RepID=F8NL96_SERL9|nr:uncharacterized protein SERLADRAFT_433994 [Serpula lacrymans var. lacrymans S7.9]EGO28144.1 hypothetical protein SERLADRAFT_433994 [Serpula lacrymans var. lacrymans S7.9]